MSDELIDDSMVDDNLDHFLNDGELDDDELSALADGIIEYDYLPPEQRTEQLKGFLAKFYHKTVAIEATSGPIPPPKMLASYEDVLPGSADRILTMAEEQQIHRHGLEREVVKSNIVNEKLGLIIAGVISLVVVICSAYLIAVGKSAEGLSIVLSSLAVIVGLFLHEQSEGKRELVEKSQQADSNKLEEN